MISGKRIFITGGAGFIGTHLIRRLIDRNQIIVYDSLVRNAIKNSEFYNHKNLKIIEGDIMDVEKLNASVKDIDIIIHLAAVAGVDTVIKSPTNTMKVNMIGTHNVLEAAKEQKIQKFVDFSTSEVYGSFTYKTSETDSTIAGSVGEARWTYATSKLAAEHLSHSYCTEFGLPVISIRPFNIYGPGQVGEGAIHNFIVQALKGESLKVFGNGDQIRSWCFVDDTVNAVMLCLENDKVIGEVFNIGNPRGTITVYGLAEKIISISKSKSTIELVSRDFQDIELRIPSIDKAQKLLGFEAHTDLNEGLQKTIDWYRNNLEK